MLKNFFKTAFRNIRKNKAYSIINFIGLTCGLTLALLIITYVRNELSFDRFHTRLDRLYRISYTAPNGLKLASTPPPIAPVMADFFPAVEKAARLYGRNVSITVPDNGSDDAFEESGVFFADSSIMEMFSFDFISGNPDKALKDPFTVVITDEMATKYFGDKDPMGQALVFGGKHPFKVVGVVKEFPTSSHIRFNMLVPYDNMFDMENDQAAALMRNNLAINFVISHSYTYVLLKPGADPKSVDDNMEAFLEKYAQPQLRVGQKFVLMPVGDIHLHSDLLAEPGATNTMTNLWIFIGVGILTLLIACINYINLATAQSLTRIKEIGIRKILGSNVGQLIFQFLAESFLFCLIAFTLSYGLYYAALPMLNELTANEFTFGNSVDGGLVLFSFVLLLVVTLLAGGYPSYFVTRFNSIYAMKGEGGMALGGNFLRKALVVFQLGIACILLSGSLMIIKQLDYLTNRPLGFQKEHIITVPLFSQNLNNIFGSANEAFQTRIQAYRDAIETESTVSQTALSSTAPGLGGIYRGTIPEGFTAEDRMFIANLAVDYDFFKTYEVEVVAGRGFSRDHGTDAAEGFMVNETAVNEFKWGSPEEAIGKTINREGKDGKVIGVVKDFNMVSLTTAIPSLVIEVNPIGYNTLAVKIQNDRIPETTAKLEKVWNDMFPEKAFQFNFLDQQLDQQYANFQNFGRIIQTFTLIAILISCLGVYGLVLFVVQRKVKEIGVRKVLGANIVSILKLIYRDFALLLGIAFVIGVPFSYYLIDQWLENFIYHTQIDVLTYVLSFVLVVVVVALTVSYQAVKASLANPVNSLRSE